MEEEGCHQRDEAGYGRGNVFRGFEEDRPHTVGVMALRALREHGTPTVLEGFTFASRIENSQLFSSAPLLLEYMNAGCALS